MIPKMARRHRWLHPPLTAIAIALVVTAGLSACEPAPTVTLEPSPAESPPFSPTPTQVALDVRERLAGIPLPEADERRSLPRCDSARPINMGPSEPAAQPLAAGPIELDVVGQLGGRLRAAMMLGDRLVVGVGPRVLVFQTQPTLRQSGASAPLEAAVMALTDGDDVVVAALGAAGIALLDLESGSPEVVGSLTIAGIAHSTAISDRVAYVASGPAGLRMVDLTDPSRPREMGAVFGLHEVLDVAVLAGRAYVAAADEGLLVADVSDPQAPRELGRLFTGGYTSEVEITGTTAYVADGWGGLRVIDVADPSRPTLLGTLPTAGWAMDVAVQDGTAYVAAGAEGLIVADVTKSSNPKVLATLPLAHRQAAQVVVGPGVAYVVDPSEGLQLVDIRSAASPEAVATWQPLTAAAIAVAGDRAFVAGGRSGLRSVDLTDPTRPAEGAGLPTIAPVESVAAVADRVLFSTIIDPASDEVTSLFGADASSPEALRPGPAFLLAGRLGRATFPIEESEYYGTDQTVLSGPAWSVAVQGSMVLYAIEAGLLIVDGGGPSPCELAFLETSLQAAFTANSVAVRGHVAYLGIDPGMYVIDITDPRAPELVKRINDGGAGPSLINGNLLYVAADETLFVFEISEPLNPRLVGSLRLPPQPVLFPRQHTIALAGGRLFVTAGAGGVVAVDVSDPTRPRLAGGLTVPGEALGVATDGAHLYIGSDEAGLIVADWRTTGSGPSSGHDGLAGGTGWNGLVEPIDRPPSAIAPRDATSTPKPPTGCVVTSNDDEGPGTLRECLDTVQPGEAVAFDADVFSVDDPGTILVASPLLVMTPGLTIDGRGAVILDGGGQVEAGFDPNATSITIRGVHIRNFDIGILLSSSTSGSVVEGNVIAGNRVDLAMEGTHGNLIVDNRIGVDASGRTLVRHPENSFGNMNIEGGSSLNRFERNVVGWSVFVVDSGSTENAFVGNRVGVDASGRRLPCECAFTVAEPDNQIGGPGAGDGNVFGGGVMITHDNVLLGNVIRGDAIEGFDDAGKPRELDAPRASLTLQGPGNVVGGRSARAGNQIGGSWAVDVWPGAVENVIVGNAIGGLAGARHRTEIGIRVLGSANVMVANDVVAAGEAGIVLAAGSSRNVLAANAFVENVTGGTDGGSGNQWDFDGRGNFWSDYEGGDLDGDGIGDSPRRVAPNGIDRYPLTEPPDRRS
jgi:hypothetical protein